LNPQSKENLLEPENVRSQEIVTVDFFFRPPDHEYFVWWEKTTAF